MNPRRNQIFNPPDNNNHPQSYFVNRLNALKTYTKEEVTPQGSRQSSFMSRNSV